MKNSPAVLQKSPWHPPSVLSGSSEPSGPGMRPQCRTPEFGTLENMDAKWSKHGRKGGRLSAVLRKRETGDLLEKLWVLLPRLIKR